MSAFPLEVWMKISYLACTDGGTTGCWLSQTCTRLYDASKPHKLRSISLKGISRLVAFVLYAEGLPESDRRVEHLYIATSTDRDIQERTLGIGETAGQMLLELYKPGLCDRRPGPSPDEIVQDDTELLTHAIMRALRSVSKTLRTLHISMDAYRDFIFFPLPIDNLEELTLQGAFESSYAPYIAALPTLPKLRRLKMTHVYLTSGAPSSTLFASIGALAPQLTHLYLEIKAVHEDVIMVLREGLHPHTAGVSDKGTSTSVFPFTLEKVYLHPGTADPPQSCLTGTWSVHSARRSLERFCLTTESKIVYFKQHQYGSRSFDGIIEGEKEWLDRLDGGLGAWDDRHRIVTPEYAF